jgi:glyoxylase-like metal-dependent hydrolase (beta-lactamase superfamily II)
MSGPLDCHVYAVLGAEGLVLVDAGAGTHTEQLLRNVATDFPGSSVKALLITHCHMDHCGGAADIREQTGCRVIVPAACKETLENADEEKSGLRAAREQAVYPPDFHLRPCRVDQVVADGETFTVAGIEFTVIHVRGHSRDSHCYLNRRKGANWLFTGDVIFYGAVLGVINAEGSGMDGYRSDLSKLGGLRVDGLFPGHGLFTLSGGQKHLDCAIEQCRKGFIGPQIGQGGLIF